MNPILNICVLDNGHKVLMLLFNKCISFFSDVHGPVNRSGSQVKRMCCGAHVNIASESSHHSS